MSTRPARSSAALAVLLACVAVAAAGTDASAGRTTRTAAAPSREGAGAAAKNWRQLGRVLRPRNTVTLARARDFRQVNLGRLDARRAQLGQPRLRGLLLDVDETLAPHHGRISGANKAHIRSLLAQGVTIGIYSNARDDVSPGRAEDFAELRAMGVYIAGENVAAKPSRAGFEAVTRGLIDHARSAGRSLDSTEIAMVGDNYMTDGGSIAAGLAFIKVHPVRTDNRPFRHPLGTFAKRTFQRATRAYGTFTATVHDRIVPGRPAPLDLTKRPAPAR
jgi:predicted HAD superfamily phosphohydrolase YqeG